MEANPDLEQIIRSYFDGAQSGDQSWARRHIARHEGLRVVGSGADEFFAGAAAYDLMTGGSAHLKASVSISDLEAYSEGTVGWGMARAQLALPDAQILSIRWSAVFRLEGEDWKAVQIHTSSPVG